LKTTGTTGPIPINWVSMLRDSLGLAGTAERIKNGAGNVAECIILYGNNGFAERFKILDGYRNDG